MNKAQRELIGLLIETEALQFGSFTLKSGESSPFFVDLGRVRTGWHLDRLGRRLGQAVAERFPDVTLLFGPAYKGITLATVAAIGCLRACNKDLAVCYDRKEAKAHGEKGRFIGQHPTPRDRVVIVDDVISSGGTKLEAAKALEEAFGVQPVGVLVTVDRTRRGHHFSALPVHALATLHDLADYLAERGDPCAEQMRRFWEGA